MTESARPRVSMSVGWRLAAGVVPSLVAVVLVAGLLYDGETGRTALDVILIVAAALSIASTVLTWVNARYFVRRIARLAHTTGAVTREVDGERECADDFDRMAKQRQEEATMLAGVVTDSLAQLDEVRLPLQILLESKFGDLNENQEELLRDARNAADAIDTALRRLGQVADADRGAMSVQRELVQINDVVRSVMPLARAAAERQGARVGLSLEPGLQRVFADRARLAEALTLLATDAALKTGPEVPLSIATERDGAAAVIRIAPAPEASIVASRLVTVQGGALAPAADSLTLRIGS